MSMNYTRNWTAFHIFLHDVEQQERFIREWLSVKVKDIKASGSADAWFFLRYWDGGPHVRVRFLNLKNAEALQQEIQSAAQQYISVTPLTAEQYYGNHSFDGEPVDFASLQWHDDGSVEMFDYEPEFARYGGELAITVNEDLFYISSEIAQAIIAATQGKIEQRLQLSMKIIACSIFAINPEPMALQQFATYYAEFWRGHAGGINPGSPDVQLQATLETFRQETINNSSAGGSSGGSFGVIGTWVNFLKKSVPQWQKIYEDGGLISPVDGSKVSSTEQFHMAIMSMVGSQIHMLNNRLGVTPAYEFVLASRIRDALATNASATSSPTEIG
ncbi:hypothetical protein KIH87_06810 [Paraneptunicella aestuarii]|uniref:lantibiotic dehydratase C-terminal domain-containing protein n=1 Tax=Paraneptunicella aestuarii TaxID=2831148 RepID=UPI001E3EB7D7|nr:lantibiotic dehydratase C-terminal domain-containing protein [Paraneptunicella aestuarii]UAA40055.1 hypothetical protein KIH87_06810 [Paraneptunicella aestuarii]